MSGQATTDWRGRQVTVMGLGSHGGGVAAATYLAKAGAQVTITDIATEAELQASLTQLHNLPIAGYQLGGHTAHEFETADTVVVNPAVRPSSRWLELARRSGTSITSEIELLLRACPAQVIGITGSNGKSTTAAMTAAALQSYTEGRVWLGGNIGQSLLPELDAMSDHDIVVLELSSFQLHWLNDDCPRPTVAVLTSIAPNHLDWHETEQQYLAAKRRIIDQNTEALVATLEQAKQAGLEPPATLPWNHERLPSLLIPGEHNRANAALAARVAERLGLLPSAIETSLARFTGLPHRLQTVGVRGGRTFLNDSQATSPAATVAALQAQQGPVRLLCGGADKGADWTPLAREITAKTSAVACYGATGAAIGATIRQLAPDLEIEQCDRFIDACRWCWTTSQPGETILLSPACSSFDQFESCEQRGMAFADFFDSLPDDG